jgi:hypothetical protein
MSGISWVVDDVTDSADISLSCRQDVKWRPKDAAVSPVSAADVGPSPNTAGRVCNEFGQRGEVATGMRGAEFTVWSLIGCFGEDRDVQPVLSHRICDEVGAVEAPNASQGQGGRAAGSGVRARVTESARIGSQGGRWWGCDHQLCVTSAITSPAATNVTG